MVVIFSNFKNIFFVPELRRKLAFTLGVLAVYRFGAHVPIPGVNTAALSGLLSSGGMAGGLISYLDLFSGGALKNFAIFALGMIPYINASIMMQLLTVMLPSLEQLSKEGEYGRKVIGQYTRYLTLGLSIIQGFGLAMLMESQSVALNPGWGFRLTTILILSVGALLVMWLGEQINAHGLGNGSSVIIFAGIVVGLPTAIIKLVNHVQMGQTDPLMAGLLVVITLAVIACVIFLEKGERRVPVQYAKRVIGHKVYGGQSSYIPLKINPSGVIPVIFAGSIIQLPMVLSNMLSSKFPALSFISEWFAYGGFLFYTLEAGLIIFFAFFYTAVIFNPVELADNIRKSGGFIPGIRPGKRTSEFFDYLLTRVVFPGAIYLALLAVAPGVLQSTLQFPIMFSGISLLIVIGVAMDISSQIESHLIERKYEGFLSTGRMKGRYGR